MAMVDLGQILTAGLRKLAKEQDGVDVDELFTGRRTTVKQKKENEKLDKEVDKYFSKPIVIDG